MHGAPALAPGFESLPYANPDAPVGGALSLGVRGGFDSLNPYLIRGRAPRALREHVLESLLARSYDEPFTLYPLLAEAVETNAERSAVTFTIDRRARFSDGSRVQVEDVIWSFTALRDEGRPYFGSTYGQVARIERPGPRQVRFVFTEPNRELPLLLGLMPVFSERSFAGASFAAPGASQPLGSGPYLIDQVEMGRAIRFRRNPDYWGWSLGVNRGRHNFETVDYAFFRDGDALWEAFTAGAIDALRDDDPVRWASAYDFPRARAGEVVQSEITHGRPSGMRGFVFNTRRPLFEDRRVREALAAVLDWRWANDRLHRGGQRRIESYFSGSELGFRDPIDPAARALLAPLEAALPDETLTQGWRPPAGAGDGRNRANLRRARALLQTAGWRVDGDALRNAGGTPFAFEILLASQENEAIARVFADQLKPLGVQARIRVVDAAQYADRLNNYDYDMIIRLWALSLSPGEEQRFYWASYGRDTPGTRNYMGVADPAVDAMIDALIAAPDRSGFASAARALDRALSSGVYVIPLGRVQTDRLGHDAGLRRPDRDALYGLWPGVWPSTWWRAP